MNTLGNMIDSLFALTDTNSVAAPEPETPEAPVQETLALDAPAPEPVQEETPVMQMRSEPDTAQQEDTMVYPDTAQQEEEMPVYEMSWPEEEPALEPESVTTDAAPQFVAPPEVRPYTKGGLRYQLVFEGVCVACAHCGLKLTDSASIERGLGPICSKKGYIDDVEVKDDTEAMLALAEYPELVDYLVKKYKPQGNRGLVNGLTRTASLNRRTPVHAACTDAIEALGYKRLASALRESIAVIDLYESKESQEGYGLWIKRSDFNWDFYRELKRLDGVHFVTYPKRSTMVPKRHRVALAELFVKHYAGLYIKTPRGTFKIGPEWLGKNRAAA